MLLNEAESKALCDKLLGYVKADDAEVSVSSEVSSHLRFADNAFRTSGRREDAEVRVTVWIDKKKGSATGNELDDASLRGRRRAG
jgi:predicted Zn-dependent protease